MASNFEKIINEALKDPKQTFFKKHKISDKEINVMRKAKEESVIKKTKQKKETLLSKNRNRNRNNYNKTLLG